MNILITGGVGFIGTNTALYFSQLGHNVVIIDNFSRTGVLINSEYLTKNCPDITIINADVKDVAKYQKHLTNSEIVIHLAGQTAVTTSIEDPLKDFENNLHATLVLLESIRNNNPTCLFIYSSTNKVYGNLSHHNYVKNIENGYTDTSSPHGISESEPLNFSTPYGCSKGSADQYVLDYSSTYNLNTVVFRQSCIYGPFQQGVEDQGWVAHFSKQILNNKPITIYGDGYQVRDLLFIDDLVYAYHVAIENHAKLNHRVFNIGGGLSNAHHLLDVIQRIENITKLRAKISFKPTRTGDQLSFISSNQRVSSQLNWQPLTNIDLGLEKLIGWQQKNL